jgi:hypothetical protein
MAAAQANHELPFAQSQAPHASPPLGWLRVDPDGVAATHHRVAPAQRLASLHETRCE